MRKRLAIARCNIIFDMNNRHPYFRVNALNDKIRPISPKEKYALIVKVREMPSKGWQLPLKNGG